MMFKRMLCLLVALTLSVSVSACRGNEKKTNAEVTVTPAPTVSAEAAGTEATPTPTAAAPAVTGDFQLPVEGERPVAVMIDNEGTRSLPQGGMYKAQVIYEIIVEGGETRLMPVFWGTAPEMIGPVRSSRHYFLDYVLEHDAIYVHFGWSPMAQRDIPKLKINNINGVSNGGQIFWDLTKQRSNWQDSYTSMQKIMGYAKKVKYRTSTNVKPVFKYNSSNTAIADGKNASKVTIRFSHAYTCSFEYDANSGLYNRFRKSKAQMERNTGKQLTGMNIIIQMTPSRSIKGDDKGRQEVSTVGSGSGYLITEGKSVAIKWSKAARGKATKYTYQDGTEISLNPGQTWVEVLPTGGKVTLE